MKRLLIIMFLLTLINVKNVYADAEIFKWEDYSDPLLTRIKVCHNKSAIINVNLPEQFLHANEKIITLVIKVTSDSHKNKNKDKGFSFESYRPYIRLNKSVFFGNYSVPVKKFPATQTHEIKIKKKYLNLGDNEIKISHSWRDKGYCTGSCCGFYIDNLYFKNAPKSTYDISFSSNPSQASLYLNNEYQGFTPTIIEIQKGLYNVKIEKEGYEIFERSFRVYDNQDKFTCSLTKNEIQKQKKDTTPPKIYLTDARGIKKVNSSEKKIISGKAVDESGIDSVYINRIKADLDQEGNFWRNVLLKPGLNNILIEAIDIYNNKSTEEITITRNEPIKDNKEKRLALIIGNGNYIHGGSLKNSINDIKSINDALLSLNFNVLKYENVNQREMKKAIDGFGKKLKEFDVGLFFYAGHGVQVKGINYLIPIDAKLDNENDVEYDSVNIGRVLAKMEYARNKTNIIILDACRDNPFERSWNRGAKGKGLAFMNAPPGTLIAYATSPGRTASDGEGNNGLYTSVLLKHIQFPAISILKMFQKVRKDVIEQSSGNQVPWESTSLINDFYFKE